MALPGTQHVPRSGILLLRVRAERNVRFLAHGSSLRGSFNADATRSSTLLKTQAINAPPKTAAIGSTVAGVNPFADDRASVTIVTGAQYVTKTPSESRPCRRHGRTKAADTAARKTGMGIHCIRHGKPYMKYAKTQASPRNRATACRAAVRICMKFNVEVSGLRGFSRRSARLPGWVSRLRGRLERQKKVLTDMLFRNVRYRRELDVTA